MQNLKMNHSGKIILTLLLTLTAVMYSQTSAAPKGTSMHASGPFEVKLTPQDDKLNDGISRMVIEKQFHGDLEGASKGQMLAVGSAQSSGVYVAIETITGTLQGKTGTFALYHTGVMAKSAPTLSVNVVPDSGTGQLQGISGKMTIKIAGGKHSYDFEYTLANP
jgi:osmotically-inducible protein OsmY